MTDSQKTMIKDKLATARVGLLDVVDPFGDAEWATVVYSEEQEWTVADILRHLTGAEASMTRLIELIRDGGDGVPADFDLQRWNSRGVQKAGNKLPSQLIAEMSPNRARLIETIDSLQDDDWSKSGRHGSLRIMTIEQILNLIADHEMQHTQDIREAVTN
jgi:uncharacterized protein (TIGR03083 family)